MAQFNWVDITRDDVLKAIDIFNRDNPEYPEPKVTFIIYKNQKLPAKHIRGMAYKVAYGKDIRKSDYSGGMETVRFFERLGFEMYYIGKTKRKDKKVGEKKKLRKRKSKTSSTTDSGQNSGVETKPVKITKTKEIKGGTKIINKGGLKIGLYLQTDEFKNKKDFYKALDKARNSEFDIFVLPEVSYFPFVSKVADSDIANEEDLNRISEASLDLSKEMKKAVIISSIDKYGTIFSLYANALADKSETEVGLYVKHTATYFSVFDFDDYDSLAQIAFEPIVYKGYKIGMTICYDCNHSLFSRVYGLKGIDILINSTGGDVIYDKWYKYNKVRAIENSSYNFVTMGGDGTVSNSKNYVYGFNRQGKELRPINAKDDDDRLNISGKIYIYDISLDDGKSSADTSLNQAKSVSKNYHLELPVGRTSEILKKARKIREDIYVYPVINANIIFCVIAGDDILKPKKVLSLLYSKDLEEIDNKRYIIINKYKSIDKEFYENKLSVVLKVRAMENFCAVILESDNIKNCYQSGKNRTAQVVQDVNGLYGIDLSRTTGPEAIWKNKNGMRAIWREKFEWLIDNVDKV